MLMTIIHGHILWRVDFQIPKLMLSAWTSSILHPFHLCFVGLGDDTLFSLPFPQACWRYLCPSVIIHGGDTHLDCISQLKQKISRQCIYIVERYRRCCSPQQCRIRKTGRDWIWWSRRATSSMSALTTSAIRARFHITELRIHGGE